MRLAFRSLQPTKIYDSISNKRINIFRENNGTIASMDLCTVLLNKIRPKATANTEIHNKPCESCDIGQRCFPLVTLSYSSASICHACFQSKRITAGSGDKYMSMGNFAPLSVFYHSNTSTVKLKIQDLYYYEAMTSWCPRCIYKRYTNRTSAFQFRFFPRKLVYRQLRAH